MTDPTTPTMQKPEAASTGAMGATGAPCATEHALIVDDHPAIRLAVSAQLQAALGFRQVHEAESALTAMGLMREHRPRLAIIDLDLPGLPGIDLIERLVPHYPATRVMVLSAMDLASSLPRALRAGAHGYVAKQCGLEELVDALRAVMAGYLVYPDTALADMRRASEAANNRGAGLTRLSSREITVLQYLARGHANKAIAESLLISSKTVSTHKANILAKLNLDSLVDLVDFARDHRLVP